MIKVVDFDPEHITHFANFGGQEHCVETFRPNDLIELKMRSVGSSVTFMKNGIPIGCAGIAANNPYRGLAWAIFEKTDNPRDFLYIHRASLSLIKASKFKRIEAFVDPSFTEAMRWIKLLGFTMERLWLPYFFHNGTGASAWALHKD